MKRVWIGLLAAVVVAGIGYWTVARLREEMSVKLVFERQLQGDTRGYDGNGPLVWVLPEVLVVGSAGKLQAWEVSTGGLKWEMAVKNEIHAVAAGDGMLYLAEHSGPASKPLPLRVIDGNTGQEILEGINAAAPHLVTSMVWAPAMRRLAVVTFDESVLVYDEKLALVHQVPCKIGLPEVSVCGNEVLLSNQGSLSLGVDLLSGARYLLSGSVADEEQRSITMDAPFTSSAYHQSDGSFIRVIDNSWSTGLIRFYQGISRDNPIQPGQADPEAVGSPGAAGSALRVQVDSGNGHNVTDVCWPGKWLAVSGTEDGLAFFSTETGKRLMIRRHAAANRVEHLQVSPDGGKVAALTERGKLYVWKVKRKGG